MDRTGLEQTLRDYFHAEIKTTEPSSEWWDKAISCPVEQRRRSRWFELMPKTRLAWAFLPLILLLVGGVVYGATSLIVELFQKYAPQIEQAGLAQELDLSQTIDGVTVKLERVYADSNIVLLGYTVSGPHEQYFSLGGLSTLDGQNLLPMVVTGVVPGSDVILGHWQPSERIAVISTYDASTLKGTPSELSLILETTVMNSPVTEVTTGPFRFEFNVPFHAGLTIDVGQNVEVDGVIITLEQVVISPWGTRVVLQSPNSDEDPLIVSLVPPDGNSVDSAFFTRRDASTMLYFTGDFTGQSGEWTVNIGELINDTTNQRLTGHWVFHFDIP
jgi:hypothetical protein